MRQILAITAVLVILTVSVAPSQITAQSELDSIITAYEGQALWQTYEASAVYRVSLAYTIESDDADIQRIDSDATIFEGQYDVDNGLIGGVVEQTVSRRSSTGTRASASVFTTVVSGQIVSDGDETYLEGEVIQEEDDDDVTTSYDEFTSADELNVDLDLNLFTDFEHLNRRDAIIELLETSGEIMATQTISIRQYDGDLTYYQIAVDPVDAIEALELDLTNRITDVLENDFVGTDAFEEQLTENGEMTIDVFIDAENGNLVAESFLLAVTVDIEGDNGDLNLDYEYEWSIIYLNVDEPVLIELPE